MHLRDLRPARARVPRRTALDECRRRTSFAGSRPSRDQSVEQMAPRETNGQALRVLVAPGRPHDEAELRRRVAAGEHGVRPLVCKSARDAPRRNVGRRTGRGRGRRPPAPAAGRPRGRERARAEPSIRLRPRPLDGLTMLGGGTSPGGAGGMEGRLRGGNGFLQDSRMDRGEAIRGVHRLHGSASRSAGLDYCSFASVAIVRLASPQRGVVGSEARCRSATRVRRSDAARAASSPAARSTSPSLLPLEADAKGLVVPAVGVQSESSPG